MSDTSFPHEENSLIRGLITRIPKKHAPTGTDSRHLLQYWNSTRKDHDIPLRSNIDPRGIAGMLSRTFILEEIAPGLARFRVAGTQLGDLLGMDVRGMPISAMLRPDAREQMSGAMAKMFDKPGILRAALVSPRELRRPKLEAELLILPLRDDRGSITRAIGCLVTKGEIGRTPRRFDIRHIRVDPVSVVKSAEKNDSEAESAHILPLPMPTETAKIASQMPMDATPRPKFAPLRPGQPCYLRLVETD